jgi:hypothetical protein
MSVQIFAEMRIRSDKVPSRDGLVQHVQNLAGSTATETANNMRHYERRLSKALTYLYPEHEELYKSVIDFAMYAHRHCSGLIGFRFDSAGGLD